MEIKGGKLENENDITLLTDSVRKVYSGYLEKTLTENYLYWYCSTLGVKASNRPIDWLHKCTLLYENEALKSCMILEYYRKKILEIISDIRTKTSSGKLDDKIKLYSFESRNTVTQNLSINVSTQTDNFVVNQVQENTIDTNFICRIGNDKYLISNQAITNDSKNACAHTNKKLKMSCSQTKLEMPRKNAGASVLIKNEMEDDIAKEVHNLLINEKVENDEIELQLNEMFRENVEFDEFDELFGYNIVNNTKETYDPQSYENLKQIEIENITINIMDNTNNLEPQNNEKLLKESIWPCELHMRRQKLYEILSQVDDVLLMERIKNKFIQYFGDDDIEDDFVSYSPNLELNDMLLGSCMKRIAPWIVKHLMQPLNDGLISNRYLFKKLAKSLAQRIIIENQYPSERYVVSAIQDFFCRHKRVDSIEDISV